MKWFVYLFCLYLLTLSGFTCKADGDCCEDEIIEQTTSTGHHDDDHKSHSVCVPFLACGACNSILPNQISVELPLTNITFLRAPFHYLDVAWTNDPGSVWQPPQIA